MSLLGGSLSCSSQLVGNVLVDSGKSSVVSQVRVVELGALLEGNGGVSNEGSVVGGGSLGEVVSGTDVMSGSTGVSEGLSQDSSSSLLVSLLSKSLDEVHGVSELLEVVSGKMVVEESLLVASVSGSEVGAGESLVLSDDVSSSLVDHLSDGVAVSSGDVEVLVSKLEVSFGSLVLSELLELSGNSQVLSSELDVEVGLLDVALESQYLSQNLQVSLGDLSVVFGDSGNVSGSSVLSDLVKVLDDLSQLSGNVTVKGNLGLVVGNSVLESEVLESSDVLVGEVVVDSGDLQVNGGSLQGSSSGLLVTGLQKSFSLSSESSSSFEVSVSVDNVVVDEVSVQLSDSSSGLLGGSDGVDSVVDGFSSMMVSGSSMSVGSSSMMMSSTSMSSGMMSMMMSCSPMSCGSSSVGSGQVAVSSGLSLELLQESDMLGSGGAGIFLSCELSFEPGNSVLESLDSANEDMGLASVDAGQVSVDSGGSKMDGSMSAMCSSMGKMALGDMGMLLGLASMMSCPC